MKVFVKTIISLLSFFIIILLPIFFIVWQYNLFLPKQSQTDIYSLTNYQYIEYRDSTFDYLFYMSELPEIMTENEASHMEDVRNVFTVSMIILFLSSLLLLTIIIILIKKRKSQLIWQSIKRASFLVLAIIISLTLFSFLNFEKLFIYFHEIFFPQGNWMFPPNSIMVQVFSEKLFFNLTVISLVISIILSIFLTVLSFLKLKK